MPDRVRRFFAAAPTALALVLCLGLAAPATAGLEEGKQAYRDGDYARALEEFLPLATAGDATVQNQVAAMYYIGQGTSQDLAQAAEWFRKSAAQGNADGQYCLGKLYYSGQGVAQNFEEAARLLTEAGLAGKGGAQYLLATLYLYGKGVSRNPVKAYFWSLLAVGASDLPAEDKAGALGLRDQIQAMLSQRQIDSIQAMARNWTPGKRSVLPGMRRGG
ncbi:Sel1 domain protein repeat-containing protein [Solidesulfovibrio carbinoliphilus subsp. oakridgensis]|uniref:Sel1 domain protein repeat-containing protein n=1 Tax=Solidesulfovibrio carbinoliphilus subsp. oakridgensis TaxID=694327 RepID=G7Q5R4_9BACT|nr:tetratricopeptide repeat protein [Solidesulfovibrio carbinoliphilus]EHJ49623.1 Sel1 domain protein repeat-containing protein [Solidesulfovibrio carbinoliphilus subsp. oakridgensis]